MAGHSKDIASAYGGVACTPSDSTQFPATRGVYVGVAGNVSVDFAGAGSSGVGTNVLLTALANGFAPIQVTRIYATGTAATGMVLLY